MSGRIVNRVYLVEISKTNGTMDSLASKVEKAKCYTVLAANVASFEAQLPSNKRYYMSSDEVDVVEMNGYQADGIPLPKHVVQG